MKLTRFYISFYIVILSLDLVAQSPVSFKRCLELGLENNLDLMLVRNSENIDSLNFSYTWFNFLPTVNLRGTLSNSVIDSKILRDNANAQLRYGAKANTINSGIELNWTLFDGFAMFVNYKKQREILNLGKLKTRQSIENLAAQIGTNYYTYYQQCKRLEILKFVLELSKERHRISMEKYRIGSLSKLDYQQDKIELNADSSKYLQQIELVEKWRLSLNNILSIPGDTVLVITDSMQLNYSFIYSDLFTTTREKNTSLQIAQQNKTLSQLDLDIISARNYPTIYATSGYTYYKNESQAGLTSLNRQNGYNYGLGFTLPLFNRYDVHRQMKIYRIQAENASITYQKIEQDIVTDLNIIFNAYQNSLKLLDLEKQNLQVAFNNFDIAQERFRLGNISGIEMREIQRMYLDAEDRLLDAQYQAKLAEISLKLISGQIQDYL